MFQNKTIGFVGGGQMSEAIFSGILKSHPQMNKNITVCDVSQQRIDYLAEKYNINTLLNTDGKAATSLLENSDILVLAIKPQVAKAVLSQLENTKNKNCVCLSIIAGLEINIIQQYLKEMPIIRIMPNTPMLVCAGACGLSKNNLVSETQLQTVKNMLECVSQVYEIDEHLMDAITGVSGCGPAYAYMFIQAMADGGVQQGLPRDMATQLAAQTLLGSAKMVLETNVHPEKLKDNVCSPAGGTIDGVLALEKAGFRSAISQAVKAGCDKMKILAKK